MSFGPKEPSTGPWKRYAIPTWGDGEAMLFPTLAAALMTLEKLPLLDPPNYVVDRETHVRIFANRKKT